MKYYASGAAPNKNTIGGAIIVGRKHKRRIDIDTERMHEIWRDAVDLEPVTDGHKALAVPPDVTIATRNIAVAEDSVNPNSLRVVTVPNVISFIRLILVPVLVWCLLVPHAYTEAFLLLIIIALSDWADGKIARYWHIESKIGAYLDPAADRLLTVCVPISMAYIGFIPWSIVAVVVARDVILALLVPIYERRGLRMSVIYLGKVATATLMCAFPLTLLAHVQLQWESWLLPLSWAMLLWAAGLYAWTGFLYVHRARIIRQTVPILTPTEKKQWAEDKKILR